MNYDPDYERWLAELNEEMDAKENEYYALEGVCGFISDQEKREMRHEGQILED